MSKVRGGILALIGVVAIGSLLFLLAKKPTKEDDKSVPSLPKETMVADSPAPDDRVPTNAPMLTNPPRSSQSFSKRAADMTAEEKVRLAKDFKEKYKPAVEKWFQAYPDRVPFELEDFTLDKFHSCLGDYMYTFMIGDTTFTIQDSPKLGLKVSYLMTRKGARDLNNLPGGGFVPDLTVPVAREEIIRMVKADSGVEFKPNEVIIKPTAAACALNGGAFVSILPSGADPDNALNNKISMVFGPNGRFVSYVRDPFF